jgi:large subunit ribosomal protein L15
MSMVHTITTGAPRSKAHKRKGRGESSGHGKTSGRGNKGSKARNGKYIKPGYEGGQTPIFRRLPKRGFSNDNFERHFHIVNVGDLEVFADGSTVDASALVEAGLVPDSKWPVKILGEGTLTKKITVVAGRFSKSAYDKLQGIGATVQNLKGEAFAFPKEKKKFVKRDKPKKGEAAAEVAKPVEAAKAAEASKPAEEAK